jgi:hypothetical protein
MNGNSDFLEVKGMDELSQKLIEKKKKTHCLSFDLTLALILPMAIASIEKGIFSDECGERRIKK